MANDDHRHGRRNLYCYLSDIHRQGRKKETTHLHFYRIDNRHDSTHGVHEILCQQYKQSRTRLHRRLDLCLLIYLLARVRLYRPCLGRLLTMHTSFHPIQLVYIAEIFPTGLRSRATASKKPLSPTANEDMAHSLRTVCAFMGTGTGLLFNQLSPKAFAHISWSYYAVFVVCDAVAAGTFFLIYP